MVFMLGVFAQQIISPDPETTLQKVHFFGILYTLFKTSWMLFKVEIFAFFDACGQNAFSAQQFKKLTGHVSAKMRRFALLHMHMLRMSTGKDIDRFLSTTIVKAADQLGFFPSHDVIACLRARNDNCVSKKNITLNNFDLKVSPIYSKS